MISRYKAVIHGSNESDTFDLNANISTVDAGLGNDDIGVIGVRNTLTGGDGADILTVLVQEKPSLPLKILMMQI